MTRPEWIRGELSSPRHQQDAPQWRLAKPAQALCKVDSHSKTLPRLQQHCSRASQWQTDSLHQANAIAKPGIRLCPHGSLCDPQKVLLGTCTLRSKVPFCFGKKYHPVPLLTGTRNEPMDLPRGRKDYSFSKRKRRDVPFVM